MSALGLRAVRVTLLSELLMLDALYRQLELQAICLRVEEGREETVRSLQVLVCSRFGKGSRHGPKASFVDNLVRVELGGLDEHKKRKKCVKEDESCEDTYRD